MRLLLGVWLGAACGQGYEESGSALPLLQQYPAPLVPDDNPTTCEKVTLGRYLFYDPRLSYNEQQACASCHEQSRAFADDKTLPSGSTGQPLARNSMGLTNVAYRATLTWANPVVNTLEEQALIPLLAEFPVELGLSGREGTVLTRLQSIPLYAEHFAQAFPEDPQPFRLDRIAQALAAFERTMLSFDSPYDRFLAGDPEALDDSARRGFDLFFSEQAECYHCHNGPDLTNSYRSENVPNAPAAFHNTGLYNLDASGSYPFPNVGLFEFTGATGDMGAFRIPSLRNVEVTAPYMHDGSVQNLRDVVQHYAEGGRTVASGPNAGIGSLNPHKDPLIFALALQERDKQDLVAFLRSLTDDEFLHRPALSDPFDTPPAPCAP